MSIRLSKDTILLTHRGKMRNLAILQTSSVLGLRLELSLLLCTSINVSLSFVSRKLQNNSSQPPPE